MRVIAIDWSGARQRASSKIWLAEADGATLRRLECGRDRREIRRHLLEEAERDPELVVGFDFAFSFPAWFLRKLGVQDAEALWERVATVGEDWLRDCPPPFFGRAGSRRPDRPLFRRTELEVRRAAGGQPKSTFQIAGAGAVGTGSIRGMPLLLCLTRAGFAIWPFHRAQPPLAVEIYPRLLTGPLVKARAAERKRLLDAWFPELSADHRRLAIASDDALDAAVSALVMARHVTAISRLPATGDSEEGLEGAIWYPLRGMAPAAATDAAAAPLLVDTPPAIAPERPGECPFCIRVAGSDGLANDAAFAFPDAFPVTEGHTLVVPRRHVVSLFDLPAGELDQVWHLVACVRRQLEKRYAPDGFNIGVNDGQAAGQTVPHAHVHVIPRRPGDAADPRGGVRWVIPERAVYWRAESDERPESGTRQQSSPDPATESAPPQRSGPGSRLTT